MSWWDDDGYHKEGFWALVGVTALFAFAVLLALVFVGMLG